MVGAMSVLVITPSVCVESEVRLPPEPVAGDADRKQVSVGRRRAGHRDQQIAGAKLARIAGQLGGPCANHRQTGRTTNLTGVLDQPRQVPVAIDAHQERLAERGVQMDIDPGLLERRSQQAGNDLRRRTVGPVAHLVPACLRDLVALHHDRRQGLVVQNLAHAVALRDVEVGLSATDQPKPRADDARREIGRSGELLDPDTRWNDRDDHLPLGGIRGRSGGRAGQRQERSPHGS